MARNLIVSQRHGLRCPLAIRCSGEAESAETGFVRVASLAFVQPPLLPTSHAQSIKAVGAAFHVAVRRRAHCCRCCLGCAESASVGALALDDALISMRACARLPRVVLHRGGSGETGSYSFREPLANLLAVVGLVADERKFFSECPPNSEVLLVSSVKRLRASDGAQAAGQEDAS